MLFAVGDNNQCTTCTRLFFVTFIVGRYSPCVSPCLLHNVQSGDYGHAHVLGEPVISTVVDFDNPDMFMRFANSDKRLRASWKLDWLHS